MMKILEDDEVKSFEDDEDSGSDDDEVKSFEDEDGKSLTWRNYLIHFVHFLQQKNKWKKSMEKIGKRNYGINLWLKIFSWRYVRWASTIQKCG